MNSQDVPFSNEANSMELDTIDDVVDNNIEDGLDETYLKKIAILFKETFLNKIEIVLFS